MALYTFDIGQNDVTDKKLLPMSLDQLRPIITDMINQLASSIQVSTKKYFVIEVIYKGYRD